jgi:multiple sugar transport system substrate-binding protein
MVVTTVGSKKEIVFWHSYSTDSGEYKLLVEKIIPEFEKQHSDIKIVEMQVPYDEMRRRLITATAAAQFPDVMRMDIIWVPQFAEIGVLLAVTKLFQKILHL